MKCPRCGHEMTLDTHRKYALNMCYECGYIEGRLIDPEKKGESNFERMKKLNFNEMVAFLTKGLNLDEAKLADWLDDEVKGPAPPYFTRRTQYRVRRVSALDECGRSPRIFLTRCERHCIMPSAWICVCFCGALFFFLWQFDVSNIEELVGIMHARSVQIRRSALFFSARVRLL